MQKTAEILNEMEKEMLEFKAQFERDMRCELRELKNTCEFLSEKSEEAKLERAELAKKNKALKEANEKLGNERENLKTQISEHEQRITASEQYSRNCNLDIKGIPVMEEENLPQTLQQIGELLEENIEESDIEVCHRVPVNYANAISNIIVQFQRRAKRDAVLQKARKARLSTHDLGHPSTTAVFINEHLCPPMKQLRGMAIAQRTAKNWRFVWTNGGNIMARKDESAPIQHIRNGQDVDRIV
ncbi:hypothetical protein HPB48_026906 [Haemaphysalis longicornis]|uniref:FP protein C-terminal domain-containing protein n=1 Tax=Haemaphysalis longicornis TaxID=44386 RepID=A0A9J6HBX4_HAELO|nr:hypothetical protein HPB48_026906 [Haemaphysalis longicornis]